MSSLMSVLNPLDVLLGALIMSWSGPLLEPFFAYLTNHYDGWKAIPYVNTTLVFLEKNKEVFVPIANAGKQISFAIHSSSIIVLRPMIKALVLLYNTLKPIVLAVLNVTRNALQQLRDMGLSLTTVAQNLAAKVLDFGKSLAIVTKALAQATAYIVKGVSIVIASFDNLFTLGYRILFHTRDLTWDDATSALIPLVVVMSTLGFFYWMKRPTVAAAAATAPSEKCVLRRSPRIARKRSMFLCQDLSSFPLTGKKSATTTTDL